MHNAITPIKFDFPCVMGIVNVTPDSFSDGGKFLEVNAAIEQGLVHAAEGAAIIDVGGESTRPGADDVSVQAELDRVIPVIEGIHKHSDVSISIDTSKPDVMQAAVQAGATMINDVRALQQRGALDTAAQCQVPICLMHMQGQPRSMQQKPHYDHLINDLLKFFQERISACQAAGIDKQAILLDPGFGFGKTVKHNLQLIKHLSEFVALGYPVLISVSRKSTIGTVLDKPVEQRLAGSLALAVMAVEQGAQIVRTHDVAATVDAIRMTQATLDIEAM